MDVQLWDAFQLVRTPLCLLRGQAQLVWARSKITSGVAREPAADWRYRTACSVVRISGLLVLSVSPCGLQNKGCQ